MKNELKWPMKLKDAIDELFSHNEIIALWYDSKEYDTGCRLIYRGEAWATPDEYLELELRKFFGAIPESIDKADTINILMTVDENVLNINLLRKINMNQECTEEETTNVTISQ